MTKRLDDELIQALTSIVDEFESDEKAVRERQIRMWKKLNYYWCGFSRIYWDDTAHDWRIFDDGYGYETNQAEYYDKPMNVFRAYLESIIAALSSTVPTITATPDDADNPADIATAKAAVKISQLIYKHNDAPLLWVKALFTYCTQGMIASYRRTVEDDSYGTVPTNKYEDDEETIKVHTCPLCKADLSFEDASKALLEDDEFSPGDDDSELHYLRNETGQIICPKCQEAIDPEISEEKLIVPRLIGVINQPKTRQIIEVYGGLFVAVPNWARTQADCPYLGYSYETHYSNVYKMYGEELRGESVKTSDIQSSGNETYGRWGRLSPQYYGEYPKNTPTVRNWWLRPSTFEIINNDEIRKKLQKKFPDGVHCVWVNDTYVSASNDSLDDAWTLTYNPLSEYVHFDPLGLLLTSVQEVTQDLLSLTLQTIEHSVPQLFVDPKTVNLNQYRNTEIIPGGVYPAKAQPGKSLADSFYLVSSATLSQEVDPFSQQIQTMGQFVSGALPSIYGGADAGGNSRTAAQASMSRNQALQRLQVTWKMINVWWKQTFAKAIPAYIKTVLDDEKIVKQIHGSFVNDWIKKSELEGKIGEIEVESSDELPATFGQIRDGIMQLIQTNNPEILAILGSPENIGIVQDYVLGNTGLKAPGEADREKQYEEIQQLLASSPMPGAVDPMTSQMQEMPSVMPEMEVDNHQIEGEICRDWLVGSHGRLAKINNPGGYQNVLLHLKAHIMMNQQLMNPQGSQAPNPGQNDPQAQNQPSQDSGKPNQPLRPVVNNNA